MKLNMHERKVFSVLGMAVSAITAFLFGGTVPSVGWAEGVNTLQKMECVGLMFAITVGVLGIMLFSEDS